MNINQQVVSFVDDSGKTLKEAEQLIQAVVAEGTKVASIVPGVVGELTQCGIIDKAAESRATEKLSSHEGCLEVISNLVQKSAHETREFQRKIAAAGSGSGVSAEDMQLGSAKSAEVDRSRGGLLGQRRGLGEKSAADMAFENALNGV